MRGPAGCGGADQVGDWAPSGAGLWLGLPPSTLPGAGCGQGLPCDWEGQELVAKVAACLAWELERGWRREARETHGAEREVCPAGLRGAEAFTGARLGVHGVCPVLAGQGWSPWPLARGESGAVVLGGGSACPGARWLL